MAETKSTDVTLVAPGVGVGTPSRKEVVNQLSHYFGPIGQLGDVDADRLLPSEIQTLPAAYRGRSKFLMSKLEKLVVQDDHWIFTRLFPFEYTEDLHVSWEYLRLGVSFSFSLSLSLAYP